MKNTLRSLDHLTITTPATAPLPYRRQPDIIDDSREVFVHVPLINDQHPTTEVIAIVPLNRSEICNTKPITQVDWTRSTTPWKR
jgi:hypothetical protein